MSEIMMEREKYLSFSKTIESRTDLLRTGGALFRKLPSLTLGMLLDSLRSLCLVREIRLAFNQCDAACSNPKCLKNEDVRIVRDRYMDFSEEVSEIPVMNFFIGWLVKRTLIVWDDLLEDMTIASDAEFRNLIMRIAEKVT